jgi:hypothetical protein
MEELRELMKGVLVAQQHTEKAQQRTEEELKELIKDTKKRWSRAAMEREIDVTDAATLQLDGATDISVIVGDKIPAPDGRLFLEWDGLIWWPDRSQLLCIEAKTTVRDVHIGELVERVKRMGAYLEEAQAWVDKGRPSDEGVSQKYGKLVDRVIKALGHGRSLKDVQVKGVLGPLRSATGKLGQKATRQGLYIVSKPYGELIYPEDDHGQRK